MSTRRKFLQQSTLATIGATMVAKSAGARETNRRIVLASRPTGRPTQDNFRIEEQVVPILEEGQILLRTLYLSLDPYMRGRMSAAESYAAPYEVDSVMGGGTVCQVEDSRNENFKEGDMVLSYSGWQEYDVSDGRGVTKLDPRIARPSYALGVLGMPGLTAYFGLLELGQPKAGETVVLAASTGAVGSVVGQIAKLKGCRVVGIAGAQEKLDYATDELGYDACISHRDPNMASQLADHCPDGIDVYFENVGGSSWEAVMPLLNNSARVPVCGLIAHYNQTSLPPGPDRMSQLQLMILVKRIRMQGFIISDHFDRFGDLTTDMGPWLENGQIKYREDIVTGLENAPEAFLGLFSGNNFGKLIVKMGDAQ
jgi:NADPH-dependent curcumin reductase CurA